MAETLLTTAGNFTATINAANSYTLPPGWTGPTSPVSRWLIEITNTATFNGTLIVKARLAGQVRALKPVPYIGLYVNGAVGTGSATTSNLSTAAMVGDSLIEVDATEMEIVVDCTAYTSGSCVMTARLVQG